MSFAQFAHDGTGVSEFAALAPSWSQLAFGLLLTFGFMVYGLTERRRRLAVRAEVKRPLPIRPNPPSFSLAKTKIVSPEATRLPPSIVRCATNASFRTSGWGTSA